MKLAPLYGMFALACLVVTYALHHDNGRALGLNHSIQTPQAVNTPAKSPAVVTPTQVEGPDNAEAVTDSDYDEAGDSSSSQASDVDGSAQEAPPSFTLPPPPR